MNERELARIPLFEGLQAGELADVYVHMLPRRFEAREYLCRRGDPGESLLLIERGLAQVFVEPPEGGPAQPLVRLRSGDVVGEMSLISGEPRSADVIASVPTEAIELGQEAFASILARHPVLLANLTRILTARLANTSRRRVERRHRGEAVALVVGSAGRNYVAAIVEAAQAASPGSVAAIDLAAAWSEPANTEREPAIAGALELLDEALASHSTVVTLVPSTLEHLPLLLEQMDRVLVVAAEDEARSLNARMGPEAQPVELVLCAGAPGFTGEAPAGMRLARVLHENDSERGVAWLGRHISRTKLGLALGAGGAKGYAHIGVLQVLERAGYVVDFVAGSSIGAIVGSWLAMGMTAAEVEETMRQTFSDENVAATLKVSFSGGSSGLEVHTRLLRDSTRDRSFSELLTPLTVMTADLNSRLPAPITEGPVWEALVAATALAGLFPPYERGNQRLVDGLALVPVPVESVLQAGADIAVAVNVMNRATLESWPGERPSEPPPARGGARMLDTLLEVMDLTQLDAGARSAALADVVITPRFGPSTWRDFQLGDLFLAAGRRAAEQELVTLDRLAKPQPSRQNIKGGSDGPATIYVR